MLKKIWKFVSSPSVDGDIDEVDGRDSKVFNKMKEEEKFKPLRQSLVKAILDNEETSGIIKTMVEMESTKFSAKYNSLDVKSLLHSNNESIKSLQNIISGLSMIAKYAQHLLKKKDQFKAIPLSNPHVKTKILPMNGNGIILHQLGYTQQTDASFSFPPDKEPDLRNIASLLADILLFKVEMRYYLSDSHIDAKQIDALLPKTTLLELKQGEIHLTETVAMSMQSMMMDSTVENKEEKSQAYGSSADSSPYYSAQSELSNKDSSEDSPREGKLTQIDENCEESSVPPIEGEKKEKERPMQDFIVQEAGGSETTSLKTPSSGFKLECDICSSDAVLFCKECLNKLLCEHCHGTWHHHRTRKDHLVHRISEVDFAAALKSQTDIVEGPYGVIAQPENTAALIQKKILAAAKKKKKGSGTQDGEDKSKNETSQESIPKPKTESQDTNEENGREKQTQHISEIPMNTVDVQAGNMPDFSSIFSDGLNDINNHTRSVQAGQQSSDLQAQDGRRENKIQPQYGGGKNSNVVLHDYSLQQQQYQQQQQQHQQEQLKIQQQLPQFLQDNEQQVVTPIVKGQQPPQYHGHPVQQGLPQHEGSPDLRGLSQYDGRLVQRGPSHYDEYDGHPMQRDPSQFNGPTEQRGPLQFDGPPHYKGRPVQQGPSQFDDPPEQQSPPHIQTSHAKFQNVPDERIPNNQGDFLPHQAHHPNQFISHHPYPKSPVDGRNNLQQPYYRQYLPRGQQQTIYYNQNMPQAYQTTNFQEMGQRTLPTELEHSHASQSLKDMPQDEEQTYVQYPPMYPYPMNMSQYPRMHHPIPNIPQNPPLRQSQTYPQFSSLPKKLNDKADVKQMDRSVSTPSGFSNPAFKIIQRILSEPLASRSAVCKFKMDDLDGEINELQSHIDDLLVDDDGNNDMEVELKTRKKKELLRTKKELVKFSKEIDTAKEDDELEIYFPPSMDSPPAVATSRKEACEDEMKITLGKRSPTKEIRRKPPEEGSPNDDFESLETLTKIPKIVADVRLPSLINRNIPEEESITDNRSHIEPSVSDYKDPEKLSLKADDSLSSRQWHCEHCTFLNDASSHACGMCYKTSNVKYYISDKESELDEEEKAAGGQDRVDRMKKSRILNSQQEEEEMMAEKKKAWEEFYQQENTQSSPSGGSKQIPMTSQPGSKPVVESKPAVDNKPVIESKPMVGSKPVEQMMKASKAKGVSISPTTKSTHVAALRKLQDAANTDELKTLGLALVTSMKEADVAGFNVDAVPIAITFYDPQTTTVLRWLRDNWQKNLLKIVKEVSELGESGDENNIGQLSLEEAESACIECQGNLKNAVELCVKAREKVFDYLENRGTYSREEILNAVFTHKGDREKAEEELVKSKLQGFLEWIWAEGDEKDNMVYQDRNNANIDLCVSGSNIAVGDDGFQTLLKDMDVDRDRRIRMILVEGRLKSWGRAQMVIEILDQEQEMENVCLEDIVEAVCNCTDRQNAIALLQQQCQICYSYFPMTKIQNLSICQCKLCVECLQGNFEVTIKEKHVSHWTCPLCFLPDMNSDRESHDYIHMLGLLLTPLVGKELLDLFENKVRDFTLQKDPSFRWCINCGNGFLADNRRGEVLTCPHCQERMCFMCKRKWEPQHEDKTCEQFQQWKIDNDPNNQAIGLARHLEENGIDCPQCKMRYALAKGGCMHFKCPECGYEFCCGCDEKFYQHGVCKKYQSCEQKGFHCHHPRDCFFYLRDNKVEELQELLETHKVPFNIQVPEDQEDKGHCPVMEQKEDGKDIKCGKDVQRLMAGLCESHYKEYLTGLINKNALDPVFLMDAQELLNLLNRYELPTPPQAPNGPDKDKLLKMIEEQLPLKRKKLGK